MGALAAAYVLLLAVIGPILARWLGTAKDIPLNGETMPAVSSLASPDISDASPPA